MLLEACVDTLASALAAEAGGADRVELCDNLADAGTTPSHGALLLVLERLRIPVFPMIRPRGGAFVCDDADLAVMRADLRHARDLGAPGAVIGAVTARGDVDVRVTAILRSDGSGMQLTFHRAFDTCRDPYTALESLVQLGIDRVLTSGQADSAWEGRDVIARLVQQAEGRIAILAGGGVDESNAVELVSATGAQELHVRGTRLIEDPAPAHRIAFRKALPGEEHARAVTDSARIAAIKRQVS